MATLDVKNIDGTDTGNSENIGRITVKGNRNNTQKQDLAIKPADYAVSKFDSEGPKLLDRFDDPRYYQGDAVT